MASGSNVGLTASASPATRDSASIASYAITTNSANLFAINPTSGVIVLSGDLDYESSSSHSITVTATTTDGVSATQQFTINVADVDDTAPVAVADSANVEVGGSVVFDGVGSNAAKLLANDTDAVGVTSIASVNGVAFNSLTNSANSTYTSGAGYKQVAGTFGTLYIKNDGHQLMSIGSSVVIRYLSIQL